MKELAQMIEDAWMTYNAATINKLHPEVPKNQLANIMINNCKDIITALRVYAPEMATVVTGDMEPPRKAKKRSDGDGER